MIKRIRSPGYNYNFNDKTGFFARWGYTEDDDPNYSPLGPEILDLEISTICNGVPNNNGISIPCKFCYKSNTSTGKNMSFDMFKTILDKMPDTLTQVAFGADAGATSNPDLFKMAEYARSKGVVPNITVANITDETADKLVSVMGAVAVSRYDNKDICYDSVKRLTDRGLTQVNIHQLASTQSFYNAKETILDIKNDERLEKLNAIVFLSLKKKGRGESFDCLSQDKFNELINLSFDLNISFGMDSCSACKFLNTIKDRPDAAEITKYAEPCESLCFSSYFSVDGDFYPCSFAEGSGDWKEGLSINNCNNFIDDIWNHPKSLEFRTKLLANKRNCPLFEV